MTDTGTIAVWFSCGAASAVAAKEVFEERAEQSRRLGARLVRHKGARIFLDELPADAIGRPLKSMKAVECGLFCEEPE